jgi:hypothetical protein
VPSKRARKLACLDDLARPARAELLFPHLRLHTHAELEARGAANPAKPLVCFRRAVMGAPGMSMVSGRVLLPLLKGG